MTRKHSIIVVGNGLFGSVAATLARARGHAVTVVSSNLKATASHASGCVLAPSWLTSLERRQIDTAMGVLNDLYPVHDCVFKTNLLKSFAAQRVHPGDVMVQPDIEASVEEAEDGAVLLRDGTRMRGKVLVAAGIWSFALFDTEMPCMTPLWGASLRAKAKLPEPRIHVYAPYKQAVAFNIEPNTVWMGDGTALVSSTWSKKSEHYIDNTKSRAHDLFGLTPKSVHIGARPYVEGHKSGYLKRVYPNTWVSTGGAKNGTVLAAWQAHAFLEALR